MIHKSQNMRTVLIAATFAAPFALAPMTASAYEDDTDFDAGAAEVEVSDADIAAFADAMMDVQEIGQEWTQRMQQAEDEAEMEQMREESRDEMVSAIEQHGMTVEEYNEIATAAQNDPELAQQIQEEVGVDQY